MEIRLTKEEVKCLDSFLTELPDVEMEGYEITLLPGGGALLNVPTDVSVTTIIKHKDAILNTLSSQAMRQKIAKNFTNNPLAYDILMHNEKISNGTKKIVVITGQPQQGIMSAAKLLEELAAKAPHMLEPEVYHDGDSDFDNKVHVDTDGDFNNKVREDIDGYINGRFLEGINTFNDKKLFGTREQKSENAKLVSIIPYKDMHHNELMTLIQTIKSAGFIPLLDYFSILNDRDVMKHNQGVYDIFSHLAFEYDGPISSTVYYTFNRNELLPTWANDTNSFLSSVGKNVRFIDHKQLVPAGEK